jgi:hypothetical protein
VASVERLVKDEHCVLVHCLFLLYLVICHLTNEFPIIAGNLLQFKLLFVFIQVCFINITGHIMLAKLPLSNIQSHHWFLAG